MSIRDDESSLHSSSDDDDDSSMPGSSLHSSSDDDDDSSMPGLVTISPDTNWSTIMDQLSSHPESQRWREKSPVNQTFLHQILHCDMPIELLQKVIEIAPENLEVKDNHCRTPLFIAAWKGISPNIVRAVFEAHPDSAFVPNEDGDYPLHILIESLISRWEFDEDGIGHDMLNGEWVEIIRLLLDFYPECSIISNRYSNSPFQQLLHRWDDSRIAHDNLGELTYWILRARFEVQNASVTDTTFSPLHAIAGEGCYPLENKNLRDYFFEQYGESACHLDHNCRLPLHLAIEQGYTWIERKHFLVFNPMGSRQEELWSDSCILDLFNLSPKAGKTRDIKTRLYPFMAAAIKRKGAADLDTIFQLLKQNPYAARGLCSNHQ